MKPKKTNKVNTATNVAGIDLFFDYELALRRLLLSIGGRPRDFGRFALAIAENATRLPDADETADDEAPIVLTILRKIYNLKALYASIKGDSEGFWDFFAKLAEITRVDVGD